MDFLAVINQIGILFLLILVGYGANRVNILDENLNKGLSHLTMQVALPALIIQSMQYDFSTELLLTSFKMIGLSVLVHGVCILISLGVLKLTNPSPKEGAIIQFSLIFSNGGYMGYPVVHAIYGEMGVFYAALFNIPFNLLMWTLGIAIMSRQRQGHEKEKISVKKILLNPGVFSVFIGFILFVFSIKIPSVLNETLKIVGQMTTPLSMIVIGSMLTNIPFREIFTEKKLFVASFFRLLFIPAAVWLLLSNLGVEGITLGVAVVVAAMPAAATTAVFGALYEVEPIFASKSVFMSTLFSVVTIPLICLLL